MHEPRLPPTSSGLRRVEVAVRIRNGGAVTDSTRSGKQGQHALTAPVPARCHRRQRRLHLRALEESEVEAIADSNIDMKTSSANDSVEGRQTVLAIEEEGQRRFGARGGRVEDDSIPDTASRLRDGVDPLVAEELAARELYENARGIEKEDDDRFMRMALRLAERARGEGEVPVRQNTYKQTFVAGTGIAGKGVAFLRRKFWTPRFAPKYLVESGVSVFYFLLLSDQLL